MSLSFFLFRCDVGQRWSAGGGEAPGQDGNDDGGGEHVGEHEYHPAGGVERHRPSGTSDSAVRATAMRTNVARGWPARRHRRAMTRPTRTPSNVIWAKPIS